MSPTAFDLQSIDFISLLDTIDEGVIITDTKGVIHYYNGTQAQIDDLDPQFAVGKKVTDIYALSGDTSLIMLCIRLGKPIRNRTFFYKTNFGKVANTIHSTYPIRQGGRIIGVICFVKDYTILKTSTPVTSLPDYKPTKANGTRYTFTDIIGNNTELIRTINISRAAADSSSPVMLIGETGTGKELFAQSIHNQCKRNTKTFVAVNCAAIPENLLEGLLFGTTRGAFTGAMDKPGLLEQANGSTLFLDELLSMPVSLQAKLLRVLQEKKVRRIGSTEEIGLDVKIISSVCKPPRDAIKSNELRIDLFYRIGVVMVKIPPLRERLDDLPELVNHFLLTLNNTLGTNVHSITEEVTNLFLSYHWPGNIRELEHLLEGALNIAGFDKELSMKYFSPAVDAMEKMTEETRATVIPVQKLNRNAQDQPMVQEPLPGNLMKNQAAQEKDTLRRVLTETGGNISRSSSLLGISRQLFHYKMKKHGLHREHFTSGSTESFS